jgi:hypothetical protein
VLWWGELWPVPPNGAQEEADEALVTASLEGNAEALRSLVERHGLLAELVALRELDETPRDPDRWLTGVLEQRPTLLADFSVKASTLKAFLGVVVRRAVRAEARAEPRPEIAGRERRRALVAPLPVPPPLQSKLLRDTATPTHALPGAQTPATQLLAQACRDALMRQPPNVISVTRLGLHGLSRSHIAALLGSSEAQAVSTLERVAARLGAVAGELIGAGELVGELDDATLAFRVLLDASPPSERVRFARRTESERALAKHRAAIDGAFRLLRHDLLRPAPRGPQCLEPGVIAGYVDGTMRGASRARAEAHVSGCTSCIDEIAALSCDRRSLPLVREAQAADRSAQLAAMALGVALFDPGTLLADTVAARQQSKSARLAADLARLGRACRVLEGSTAHDRETSGLVQRDVPSDDEAPLVAFEALALGDSGTAFRAIDEAHTPAPVAARVRVLAAAAGGDAPLGHAWARAVKDGYDVDPGAVEDAECVLALGDGEALPREIVTERLRAQVPDLVRVVLALHARPTR